jgi:hypothetical protein
MYHTILLIVEKPDLRNHNIERSWADFVKKALALTTTTNKDFQALEENVFSIRIDISLNNILDLLNLLESQKLSYRYSIFDEEIEWREEKVVI